MAQAEIEVNLELQVGDMLTEKDISMSPSQQVNKDFSLTLTPPPPKMKLSKQVRKQVHR